MVLDSSSLPSWQQARRERILDAAFVLLSRSSLSAVQVAEIVEEANVARGTFYRYFQSKEHLYAEVMMRWATRLEVEPVSTQPLERLRSKAERIVTAFVDTPAMFQLYQQLQTSDEDVVQTLLLRLAAQAQRWFAVDFAVLDSVGREQHSAILWGVVAVASGTPHLADDVLEHFFALWQRATALTPTVPI